MEPDRSYIVTDIDALSSLYAQPLERSVRKQKDRLDEHSRAFIAASPLVLLGTHGAGEAMTITSIAPDDT